MTDPVSILLLRLDTELTTIAESGSAELEPARSGARPAAERVQEVLGRSPPPGYAAFAGKWHAVRLGPGLRVLSVDESRERHDELVRHEGLKGLWPVFESGHRLFALDAESAEDPEGEWPVVELVGRSVDRVGTSFLRYLWVVLAELDRAGRPEGLSQAAAELGRERCRRDPGFAEHWVDWAETLGRNGRANEAREALERGLLAATPPSPALLVALAIDALAAGRRDEARAALEDGLTVEPLTARDDDARLDAGALLLVLARDTGDEELGKRAKVLLGSGTGATGTYFRNEAFRALALGDEGRLELAVKVVEELLPEDQDVRRLGPAGVGGGSTAGAAAALQKARDALETGEPEVAVRHARVAAAERPDWGVAFATLAEALNASRGHGALEAALKATELNPELTDGWRELGDAYVEARDAAKAEAAYRQGLARDPAYSLLHAKRAQALLELGRKSEALQAIETALELGGDAFFLAAVRGDVLSAMGRHRDAAEAYDHALKVEPENHWALHQAALEHGEAGNYQRAVDLFELALVNNGDGCHQTLVDYAELMRKMGRIGDAVRLYRRAVAAVPNDPEWRQWLREAEKELEGAPN